jgi:hypothetical protein
MANLMLSTPAMYADHHVLLARRALLALDGVEEVYASAAWQMVMVSYAPERVTPEVVEKVLSEAGYGSTKTTPILATVSGASQRDPAWDVVGPRVTQTNELDREMSADYRR